MRTPLRFKKRSLAFGLAATSIDQASEWITSNLEEADVDKSDCVRMRLLFEEALLNMAEHFGTAQNVTASLERHQRRLQLRIVAQGDQYNPLKRQADDDPNDMSMSLFSVIDMHVQYSYTAGANVVRISLPRKRLNPVLSVGIAILIGAALGLIGNVIMPDGVQDAINDTVLHPISNMWIRLLQAISGPVIFLTALTATFGTKRIADFGGSRLATIVRYFAISALVVIFTAVCSLSVFNLHIAATDANTTVLSKTLDGVLSIVPGNLVEPFLSANTPQLLIIAVVTGYILATMESSIDGLKKLIQQLNTLGLTVAELACSLVPFFVALLLCLRIWSNETSLLDDIWMPLLLAIAISVVVSITILLITSARLRVSPILLVQKLRGSALAALKRGMLDFSAIDDLAGSCKRLLGIDGEFARAALPQGLFLYMPTSGVGICVFVLFAASVQQLPVDQIWLLSAMALSVVLAVATPPVTGANLLSFVVAIGYLGILTDIFLDAMVFDVVFGVVCVALDQTLLLIELIYQAKRMGFLNEDVLRAPAR